MTQHADTVEDRGGHALLWFALGTLAATYFHRRYYTQRLTARQGERSDLQSAVDDASAGASAQPIPSAASTRGTAGAAASNVTALGGNLSSADARLPVPEDPYPEGNPTTLPTGPAPGG